MTDAEIKLLEHEARGYLERGTPFHVSYPEDVLRLLNEVRSLRLELGRYKDALTVEREEARRMRVLLGY